MAGGKETPRQKMIGMMYLVLTALLAMNISKDVLNAFIQINNGLGKTNSILEQKSQSTIDAINGSTEGAKAVPFQQKVAEVDQWTDAVIAYIEEMKARVIASSMRGNKDGTGFEEYMKDGKAVTADMKDENGKPYVTKPDENQNNTSLLVGPNPQTPRTDPFSANELKNKLTKFRDDLLAINITKADTGTWSLPDDVRASIENAFKFEDGVDADGKTEVWETNNFYHMPLVAVLATLSKIQTDVMNAKNNVCSALAAGINASDLKFTDVTVAVVPTKSYVLRGDEFVAEIYLAAFNKTSQTKVYMAGEYNGDATGATVFDVAGREPSILSDPDGKARFKVNTGGMSLGDHGYRGQIAYMKDGVETYIPFVVPPFYVGEPSLVVSPTQMNVFYRGLDNPVEISVPGVGPEKLQPSCDGCQSFSKGSDGNWVVKPGQGNEATISVTADINGEKKPMGTKKFRIKRIPDPVPSFAGKKPVDSTISKGDASAAAGVSAVMENFDFNVVVKVKSFKLTVTSSGSFKEFTSKSNQCTSEMTENLKKARTGEKIFIEEIMVDMPDGTTRKLSPITLRII